MKGLRTAIAVAAGLSCLFVVLGGAKYGFSLSTVSFLAISGFFFGAIGAPEIEPKRFNHPSAWQSLSGAIGGAAITFVFSAKLEWALVGFMVGLVLGYVAPYWIKSVSIP